MPQKRKNCLPVSQNDNTLDTLARATWFSILFLKHGYWQVDVYPDGEEKTVLSTGQGLWLLTVLLFGLFNTTVRFER
jgi:hypothetical protein